MRWHLRTEDYHLSLLKTRCGRSFALLAGGGAGASSICLRTLLGGVAVPSAGRPGRGRESSGFSGSAFSRLGLKRVRRRFVRDGATLCEEQRSTRSRFDLNTVDGASVPCLQQAAISSAREAGCHQLSSHTNYDRAANCGLKLKLGFAAVVENGETGSSIRFVMPLDT